MCIVDLMTEQNHGGRTSSLPLSLALNFSLWEVVCIRSVVFPPLNRSAFHLPRNSTASSSLATGDTFLRSHTSLGQTRVCRRHDMRTSQLPPAVAPVRSSFWLTCAQPYYI